MQSVTDIVNMALAELGADPIMDITAPSATARAAKARWNDVRDAALRAHPWNCALARARLPADVAAPAYGFARAFTLPASPYCLRVLEVEGAAGAWQVEGRKILTDLPAPLSIRFIARVEDPAQWDALLVRAVALALAAAIAYRITQSGAQTDRCQKLYEAALREARQIDGQEGPPQEIDSVGLLEARR